MMAEDTVISLVLTLLKNDVTFKSKLSTLPNGTPMLIYAPVLPEEWAITSKSVNIYPIGTTTQLPYGRILLSASCRGNTYKESRSIALDVHRVLNRLCADDYFIETTVASTILPFDAEVDNYNTPVDILVRTK